MQTIVAQVLAAVFVIGSYFLAEEMRVRRPRRRGGTVAVRATRAAEHGRRAAEPADRLASRRWSRGWSRTARMRGERVALASPGAADLTYADSRRRRGRSRARCASGAIRPGDRVALALPSAELVPALHGCLLIGAIAVPIDLRLGTAERASRQASAALVLDEPLRGDPIDTVHAAERTDTATLMFTSGTTAGPKPVALSYGNWEANAAGSALALGLDPAERWLCPMPLAHVGGLSIQLRSAIYGTSVVLHERFDAGLALAALMDPHGPDHARVAGADDALPRSSTPACVSRRRCAACCSVAGRSRPRCSLVPARPECRSPRRSG